MNKDTAEAFKRIMRVTRAVQVRAKAGEIVGVSEGMLTELAGSWAACEDVFNSERKKLEDKAEELDGMLVTAGLPWVDPHPLFSTPASPPKAKPGTPTDEIGDVTDDGSTPSAGPVVLKCTICVGRGEIVGIDPDAPLDADGDNSPSRYTCRACGGSGNVPTGRKIAVLDYLDEKVAIAILRASAATEADGVEIDLQEFLDRIADQVDEYDSTTRRVFDRLVDLGLVDSGGYLAEGGRELLDEIAAEEKRIAAGPSPELYADGELGIAVLREVEAMETGDEEIPVDVDDVFEALVAERPDLTREKFEATWEALGAGGWLNPGAGTLTLSGRGILHTVDEPCAGDDTASDDVVLGEHGFSPEEANLAAELLIRFADVAPGEDPDRDDVADIFQCTFDDVDAMIDRLIRAGLVHTRDEAIDAGGNLTLLGDTARRRLADPSEADELTDDVEDDGAEKLSDDDDQDEDDDGDQAEGEQAEDVIERLLPGIFGPSYAYTLTEVEQVLRGRVDYPTKKGAVDYAAGVTGGKKAHLESCFEELTQRGILSRTGLTADGSTLLDAFDRMAGGEA